MKILYEEGPERVWMGAEQFNRGEAKEVEDGLAKQIMGKGTIKFKPVSQATGNRQQATEKTETKGKGGND